VHLVEAEDERTLKQRTSNHCSRPFSHRSVTWCEQDGYLWKVSDNWSDEI